LSDFNETLIFSINFRKIFTYKLSLKARPEDAELFHEDGMTDMTTLTVAFRNFANVSKNDFTLNNSWASYSLTISQSFTQQQRVDVRA
jgi:hypothetical protein